MKRFSTTASVLIDSNVLVIAHAQDHPQYLRTRQVVADAIDGITDNTVAEQNLLEWYSTVTNERRFSPTLSPDRAKKELTAYRQSELTIIRPNERTFAILEDLLAKDARRGRRIYDLYLAATMLSHGIDTILTENVRDFARIPGITAINPFAA